MVKMIYILELHLYHLCWQVEMWPKKIVLWHKILFFCISVMKLASNGHGLGPKLWGWGPARHGVCSICSQNKKKYLQCKHVIFVNTETRLPGYLWQPWWWLRKWLSWSKEGTRVVDGHWWTSWSLVWKLDPDGNISSIWSGQEMYGLAPIEDHLYHPQPPRPNHTNPLTSILHCK